MPLLDQGLEILSDHQCRRLLGDAQVGRLGLSIHALPVILPVNYRVIDGRITFWSAAGMKLDSARSHAVVAFEVDQLDETHQAGWSVLVVGVAQVTHDSEILAAVRQSGLQPWVQGDRPYLVQVAIDFVSGRRICAHDG